MAGCAPPPRHTPASHHSLALTIVKPLRVLPCDVLSRLISEVSRRGFGTGSQAIDYDLGKFRISLPRVQASLKL